MVKQLSSPHDVTCCRTLRSRAVQRAVAENQAICFPRKTRANVTSVAVIVANFVRERKRTRGATVTSGAGARVRVMLQGPVTIAAVIDELVLRGKRDGRR
jgi:hypothetical protein